MNSSKFIGRTDSFSFSQGIETEVKCVKSIIVLLVITARRFTGLAIFKNLPNFNFRFPFLIKRLCEVHRSYITPNGRFHLHCSAICNKIPTIKWRSLDVWGELTSLALKVMAHFGKINTCMQSPFHQSYYLFSIDLVHK